MIRYFLTLMSEHRLSNLCRFCFILNALFDFELSGIKVGEQMETEVTAGGIHQIMYISANRSDVSLCSTVCSVLW